MFLLLWDFCNKKTHTHTQYNTINRKYKFNITKMGWSSLLLLTRVKHSEPLMVSTLHHGNFTVFCYTFVNS